MNTISPSPTMTASGGVRPSTIRGQVVQWIQVDTLAGGDLLEVHTEGSMYIIAVCGTQRGLLTSSNKEVQGGEVLLLGSWLEDGTACWGTIRKGAGLLFSKSEESGTATKTSAVVDLFLRKYVKSSPAYSSSATGQAVNKPVTSTQLKPLGATPVKVGTPGGAPIPKYTVAGLTPNIKPPNVLPKTPTVKPRL